jgi:hypothetical protein
VAWPGWPDSLISLDQATYFEFLGAAPHPGIANPIALDKSSNPMLSFSHIQTLAAAFFIAQPSPCAYGRCRETSLPDGSWLLCPPPRLIVALSTMDSCSLRPLRAAASSTGQATIWVTLWKTKAYYGFTNLSATIHSFLFYTFTQIQDSSKTLYPPGQARITWFPGSFQVLHFARQGYQGTNQTSP